jgi:5'-3' exoribonuclease 1
MGVPGFFMWIISNYDRNQIISDDIGMDIDRLYLDANCLFHPQCFKVLDENNYTENNLEQLMIQKILDYIDYIIEYVNPKKLVYIAVDGVAPMAKMNQQRKRRFKSVYDTNIKNKIREKYDKKQSGWSNSAITPGTVFMEKLHKSILDYIIGKTNIKIVYSSYHTCGEGEHKIFADIKKNSSKNESVVVYGLDADLIFLSLATNRENIYLLREKHVFNNKEDNSECVLMYVSIDALKWCINNKINNIMDNNYTTNINYVNDFILLCYLLGNDFIPHIPSIDIYTGGLDMMIKYYVKIIIKYRKSLLNISDMTINSDMLVELFKYFTSVEDYYFRQVLQKYKETKKKVCRETDEYNIELWKIDNFVGEYIIDKINLGENSSDEYKHRYYNYYYKVNSYTDELLNEMCSEYIKGLMWTLNYYFKMCPSWDWQYPYITAPFASDLYAYLCNNKLLLNNVIFNNSHPVTPFEQLLIVLPPTCNYLLPSNYRYLMTSNESPIIDYYPIYVDIDKTNVDILWKANPMLSVVEIKRIKRSIHNIKVKKEEQYRNNLCEDFINY